MEGEFSNSPSLAGLCDVSFDPLKSGPNAKLLGWIRIRLRKPKRFRPAGTDDIV
jgi:hypothetical protein